MDQPAKAADLSPAEAARLQAILDRAQHAWQSGETIDLGRFLPPDDDPLRMQAMVRLVKMELEACWRQGQYVFLEELLQRFPELRRNRDCWPQLLAREYQLRKEFGDSPTLEDYRIRFPEEYSEMRRLAGGADPFSPRLNPSSIPEAHRSPAPTPTPRLTPSGIPIQSSTPSSSLFGIQTSADGILPVGGGYRQRRRLGKGTYGVVWEAETSGGVEVALKVIFAPLDHSSAQQELEALNLIKNLRHPYLLQIHDCHLLDDQLIIAMELADGSLRDRLKECVTAGMPGVPRDELLGYVRESAEGLDFLHDNKVLHRDIKPDNILLVKRHAKLADLGLARLLEPHRSHTATMGGSPAYMAPEVWNSRTARESDQYSLAASYVHLRLNRSLFDGTLPELCRRHLEATPDLATLRDPEQRVLHKALAKKPEDRYRTCLEFYHALEAARRTEEAPPPTVAAPPGTSRRAVLGAGAIMMAGVAAGAYFLRPRPEDVEPPPPPPPRVLLPRARFGRFQKDEKASVVQLKGHPYYDRLVYLLPDGTPIRFVLIHDPSGGIPDPFYMMTTKVSNRMFSAFAAKRPERLDGRTKWREGASVNGQNLGIADKHLDLPVFRASADEAHRFAHWLGGDLPLAEQWDLAAGRYANVSGPVGAGAAKWEKDEFALSAEHAKNGPMPVGKASRDVSIFSCRDMFSNGLEWTRNRYKPSDESEVIDFDNKGSNEKVCVRGRSYNDPTPLHFLPAAAGDKSAFDQAGEAGEDRFPVDSPPTDVSFRVALPLPAPGNADTAD